MNKLSRTIKHILTKLHIPRSNPAYHDYRKVAQTWGRSIAIIDIYGAYNNIIDVCGHGPDIKKRDYLLLQARDGGRIALYKACKIKYMNDPPDQWMGTLEFHMASAEDEEKVKELMEYERHGGQTWSRQCHSAKMLQEAMEKSMAMYMEIIKKKGGSE